MYDIDIKLIKRGRRFFYIFLAAGVFFATIIGGIPLFNTIHKNKLDSSTTSTNVEIHEHRDSDGDTMYSPAYYYEVDGQEYICTSNSSSNIRPNIDNQTIYYDSKNPSDCTSEYTQSSSLFFLIFLILPAIFIIIAVINIHKINQRVKRVEQLNTTGKLVKNLQYDLVDSGMKVNDVSIQCPVVKYTLPSGETIELKGDPRHDRKLSDDDGMVDLVIDESNPENYFIDFEINRISGNLPSDYFQQPQAPNDATPQSDNATPEQNTAPTVTPENGDNKPITW